MCPFRKAVNNLDLIFFAMFVHNGLSGRAASEKRLNFLFSGEIDPIVTPLELSPILCCGSNMRLCADLSRPLLRQGWYVLGAREKVVTGL